MELADNSALDKYTIVRKLGRGGMADVYLAYDNQLEREVAIKVLPPEFTRDPTRFSRFEKEIKATAKLNHPNLVPVYEVNSATLDGAKIHYYAMCYLPGGELKDKIEAGLSEQESIDILISLADALGYAHKNGIIHRDIKPQNIIFDGFGKPVISDLGIAKSTDNLDETRVTSTGMSLGTPYYMSPEQAMGESELDGRTDIYALGILLYEMLTQHVPFTGSSGMAVALKHIQEDIPTLPSKHSHLQPILAKCLAKDKTRRYKTADELIEDLTKVNKAITKPADYSTHAANQVKLFAGVVSLLVVSLLVVILYQNRIIFSPDTAPANIADEETISEPAQAQVVAPIIDTAEVQANPIAIQENVDELPVDIADASQQLLEQQISEISEATIADIDEYRLSSPEDNNALNKIEQIRLLAPNHSVIAELSDKVADRYLQLVNSSIANNKFSNAENYLSSALNISPNYEPLKTAANDINRARTRYQNKLVDELVGPLAIIPAGEFMMGTMTSKNTNIPAEAPVHKVIVPQFKLAKHEVSVGQFKRFIDDTSYITSAEKQNQGCYIYSQTWTEVSDYSWKNPGFKQSDSDPVLCVSYYDIEAFIDWLNKKTNKQFRLPSEAEWEYSARAGSDTIYSFGNSPDELCLHGNFADSDKIINEDSNELNFKFFSKSKGCSDGKMVGTMPVATYKANTFGLYDMHGNAAEWVADCWRANYHGATNSAKAVSNSRCDLRTIRGGSWFDDEKFVRSAHRTKNVKLNRDFRTGFRLAIDD